jgi:hypothetical protein
MIFKNAPCRLIALILSVQAFIPSTAPGSLATEVLEGVAKIAGRAPTPGAVAALEAAYKVEGRAALDATKIAGIALPEAAAKYGPDVYRLAVRVPEAASVIAYRAETILPLASRYGDDILRIEARMPGLAESAVKSFPEGTDISRLAKLPTNQAKAVISFSAHATEKQAPRALLDAVEKSGGSVLERINPSTVLAGGLSVAMIYGTHRATEPLTAIAKAIRLDPKIAVEVGNHIITIVGCLLGFVVLLLLWRFNLVPWRRKPKRTTMLETTGETKKPNENPR